MANSGPPTTLDAPPTATVEMLRGRKWPRTRQVIERVRAEAFATQAWRPGCALCGETATELDCEQAAAWWRAHRERCAA